MANGMAGLFVGASGLKTAQTALNTTAHNLSNINTTGYTRQQVTFSDTTYVNVNSKDKVCTHHLYNYIIFHSSYNS
jgi:flagellar hook-associated protein 1